MNDKDKVVRRLLGKDVIDLMEDYYKIEKNILEMLSDKKNWSARCDCEDGVFEFTYVDPDNSEYVMRLCTACGGDLN